MTAEEGGDDAVRADRFSADPSTAFALTDLDGVLQSGDAVTLQARNGFYLTVSAAGAVWARSAEPGPTETFRIWKPGGGEIRPGDAVVLQAATGRYLAADLASGVLRADRAVVEPGEALRLLGRE